MVLAWVRRTDSWQAHERLTTGQEAHSADGKNPIPERQETYCNTSSEYNVGKSCAIAKHTAFTLCRDCTKIRRMGATESSKQREG